MSTPPSNPANEPYSPLSNPRRKAYVLLSGLLSDPGLVYSDFTKGFIMRHLVDLVSSDVLLQYKIEPVEHNGSSVNLLQAYGSIPSSVVTICFPQDYPHRCPRVRVNPRDDAVFSDTSCVDSSSGAVSHAYLGSWKCHESNLASLVEELSREFTSHPPLTFPHLKGVLTPDQTKLAKILIENGGKKLYERFGALPPDYQKEVFEEITNKYRRHPDLATYIKNTETRVEAFIKNVEDVASKYLKEPVSCDSSSGSGTNGQMSPLQHSGPAAVLKPEAEKEISELFTSTSQQDLAYSDASRELIQKHLRELHLLYPDKVTVKHDLSKPYIEIAVKVPYCLEGSSNNSAPVNIYLTKLYPASRPHVGLDCPSDQVIKEKRLSVAPGGTVYFSYLRTWNEKESDLAGLVSYLSAEFTCEEPLESR
ncbi:unnamed protein product [Microthlaspi erraticum]|uniref:UEV domain-containing protein n=1 Tax=Microthlaspi erraticum TaxID=1685480 RepID=A0A6D2JZX9_9BRAS|nr:unnamed protein product [Microthlaspi erraticum]